MCYLYLFVSELRSCLWELCFSVRTDQTGTGVLRLICNKARARFGFCLISSFLRTVRELALKCGISFTRSHYVDPERSRSIERFCVVGVNALSSFEFFDTDCWTKMGINCSSCPLEIPFETERTWNNRIKSVAKASQR